MFELGRRNYLTHKRQHYYREQTLDRKWYLPKAYATDNLVLFLR